MISGCFGRRLAIKFLLGYQEVHMKRGTRYALWLGAIPFVMLVFALPLVNRIHPVILGLPFLLFWILGWVLLTPLILFLAYRVERKYNPPEEGEER
jgi:hypothetical protein